MKQILANPFLKNSAIMFVGTMGTNVLAYVYHLVVGRSLGPVGYGEIAALLSIFYILNSPSIVVQNILVKFFSQLRAKQEHGQGKQLFVRITMMVFAIELLCLVLLLPFVSSLASFLHIEHESNLLWLYLMFAVFLVTIINISALQAYQQFVAMSILNMVGGALRLGFGAVGSMFGVMWTLVANVVAGVVTYVVTFIPLRQFLRTTPEKLRISPATALYYSVPTFLAVFSVNALYSMDVVLVKHFFTSQEAGIYSSLSVLGKIIFFASYSIGQVAFPMLAERRELNKPYSMIVMTALSIVGAVSAVLTLGYIAFPSFVVSVLFGSAFDDASQYLGIFGAFISLYTLSNLLTTMYIALGKTNVWIFTMIAAVVQIFCMSLYHDSLTTIIRNNMLLSGGLFVALLVYYPYAHRKA
jgi:O-antigen/teichoic acid export membrane protein